MIAFFDSDSANNPTFLVLNKANAAAHRHIAGCRSCDVKVGESAPPQEEDEEGRDDGQSGINLVSRLGELLGVRVAPGGEVGGVDRHAEAL